MNKKNMSIAAAVLLIVVGLIVVLLVTNNPSSDNSASSTDQNGTQQVDEAESDTVTIEDYSGPYIVKIDITEQSGNTSQAEVFIASPTLSRTKVTNEGQSIEFIIDGDTFYSWSEETGWIKLPASEDNQEADYAKSFSLNAEQLRELEKFAKYQGDAACNSGTCKVYQGIYEGEEATLYIDPSSNRVISLESTSAAGDTVKVTYIYNQEVKVEIPKNAQDFSGLTQ